ncbi:MAG: hypothetical protein WCH79_03445 [Planctomycetia bacterium]
MAFVHIYRWAGGVGKKAHGHLGMVVQTPNGNKTYITMLNSGENNLFRENEGSAPSLPQDLRNMTGIRGAFDSDGMARHEALRLKPRFKPRADQKAVWADGDIQAPLAPVARRVSIRQARPGDGPKTSLLLAQGQIYRPPTEIIELPVLTPDQLGIDTDKIFHWWKSYAGRATRQENTGTFQTAEINNRYKAFSTHLNCAGTVYLALRVGGATFFKGRTFTRFYSTPDGVLKWAREVGTAVQEVNRAAMTTMARYEAKRAEFERKIGRNQQRNPEDLPTVEEWKRISHVGIFARRMDQIAVMDRELEHYHRYVWDDANQTDEKARALGQIMRSAEEHARLKPTSDRSHAVSYLISKAWEVLEGRLVENPLPEDDWQGVERDRYASLAFSDAEFQELFMGDEWIVAPRDLEYADVVFEEQPFLEEQVDGVRAIPRSRSQVHPPSRMDG